MSEPNIKLYLELLPILQENDYSLTSKSKQTVVDHHLLAILFAQKLKHCGFKFVPVVVFADVCTYPV